jgi:predicted small secreted protein
MKELSFTAFTCALVFSALTFTSCSTVKGIGQDIGKAGRAIEEKASQ